MRRITWIIIFVFKFDLLLFRCRHSISCWAFSFDLDGKSLFSYCFVSFRFVFFLLKNCFRCDFFLEIFRCEKKNPDKKKWTDPDCNPIECKSVYFVVAKKRSRRECLFLSSNSDEIDLHGVSEKEKRKRKTLALFWFCFRCNRCWIFVMCYLLFFTWLV